MMQDEYLLIIDGWEKDIIFSASHFIPYHNKCSRLHGHSYVVSIKLKGTLTSDSMVYDFTRIKKVLKEVIRPLDHRIIIPVRTKNATITKTEDSITIVSSGKRYVFPLIDAVLLPIENSTAECIARYILDEVIKKLDLANIESIELCVEEGKGQGAVAIYRKPR